jgi:alkyl hydroperoxide reductase subunit AhpF
MTRRLADDDAAAIAAVFSAIERDVRVVLELGPSATPVTLLAAGGREVDPATETRSLAEAICALSERVTLDLVEHDEPGPWPQLTVGDGLVYRGMPVGYERTALVYAIVEAGLDTPSLTSASLERLATLAAPAEVRVYVTPT